MRAPTRLIAALIAVMLAAPALAQGPAPATPGVLTVDFLEVGQGDAVLIRSPEGKTHYVTGAGEQAYLHQEEAPEITFVRRDQIDRSDEAYTELPP